MTEHVAIPFVLDKTSKISIRLAGSLHFKGDGWRCGLKTFSLDKKWSLMHEKITLIYSNGYKSVLKPKQTHSVTQLSDVLNEIFQKTRAKRSDDIFDDITFNESESEEEREVTPPPSIMPFSPDKLDASKSKEKKAYVQPPPSLLPLEPEFLGGQKLNIEVKVNDKFQVVTFPTDEEDKSGDKEYLVYKNLKEAFYFSPELPVDANSFTEKGFRSVNFTFNSDKNRYEVNYDPQYIRAIHLTTGFRKALGFLFKDVVFNNQVANFPPKIEDLHSHVHVYVNDIIFPIYCGQLKETILDIIPVSPNPNPISVTYEKPNYLKMALTRVDNIQLEFKDIYGNPVIGDMAFGHVLLEFKKFPNSLMP